MPARATNAIVREVCGGRSWVTPPPPGMLGLVYTTLRRFRVRGTAAAVGRRLEQGVVPLVAQAPGFRSYAVLDTGAGELVTITVFADRAGAEDAERRVAAWVAESLAGLVAAEDDAAGEVLVYAGL
jgi:hypothetical protein